MNSKISITNFLEKMSKIYKKYRNIAKRLQKNHKKVTKVFYSIQKYDIIRLLSMNFKLEEIF